MNGGANTGSIHELIPEGILVRAIELVGTTRDVDDGMWGVWRVEGIDTDFVGEISWERLGPALNGMEVLAYSSRT